MSAFTAKNWTIDKAPRHLELFGEKTKKTEAAQHIIEFPGGAIEVSRTSDGNYWAHILINQEQQFDDAEGRESAFGKVVGSRLATRGVDGIPALPQQDRITQIAVLIQPVRSLDPA